MKVKLTQKRRLMRGASLTESAIVLAIVGVLLGGIWAMANDMRRSVKQQKFAELLTVTVGNIRGNYTGKSSFENTLVTTMMPILVPMNVFPGDNVKAVGATMVVVSPFGEISGVHPVPLAGATPHKSFYVCGWRAAPAAGQFHCDFGGGTPNVPLFAIEVLASKSDCIQAIMRNSNPVTQPGLVAVHTNGNAALQTLPLTVAAANAACPNVAPASNYIDFVYRLTP